MNRDQKAKLIGVNAHYLSDAAFVKRQNPEMAEQIAAGTLRLQDALRQLGRVTPRERNREFKRLTLLLCNAVLDGEQDQAETLASQIIARYYIRSRTL